MTRYKLPAELGGGEFEPATHGDYILASTKGVYIHIAAADTSISLPLSILTEVPPPAPDEPPPGAYLIGDVLCVHLGKRSGRGWFADTDLPKLRFRMDWSDLVEVLEIDSTTVIRALRPAPDLDEPLAQWERELLEGQQRDREEADALLKAVRSAQLSRAVKTRTDRTVMVGLHPDGDPFLRIENDEEAVVVWMLPSNARRVAFALLAAAGPDTEREA